ncbi:MAG: chromate transporter [Symplocastrum torsivum CPER-KK1]|jgi:chromate transporter|uniref:Chromate transporter n=1 Tax=Symplocastrum torsivum CPER-KK1 TaxID=450513 RepID=A0A951PKU9_9CYAN|nr:chromate transporter [Symplocastrum torsivum CPER-KK1]
MNILFDLFFTFAYLDLISIGGAMAMIPEMERQVVIVHGWMSHQAFVHAIALGLFVPGPNMLHVFHIGNQVAGLPGALAAGLGMFGPTSFVLATVAWLAGGPRPPAWIERFHAACSPITLGLMAAAAWNLGQNMTGDIFSLGVCVLAALLTARRLLNPALVVLLAATLGAIQAFFSA